MRIIRALVSLPVASLAILSAFAAIPPAPAPALASGARAAVLAAAGAKTSPRAALAAGLTLSGPVTLQYTASTSDTDSCAGKCNESFGLGDYSSYSETASGTQKATVHFAAKGGATTPGTGQLSEPTDTYSASGSYTDIAGLCIPIDGSATEVARGGTVPGQMRVASLQVTGSAAHPDLALSYAVNGPEENTLITPTDQPPCQYSPYPYAEVQSSGDTQDVSQALGFFNENNNCELAFYGCYVIKGWTINPDWTPQDGGTLATKTATGTAPRPSPDTGTEAATQTWTLITGPALKITSPPAGKTVALTDDKYFTPQPGPNERQPEERKLTVEGTALPGDTSITLNGVQVPVTLGAWKAELPITMAQLGQLTLKASDGTSAAEQTNTLIDIEITNPTEDHLEPITEAPAMPSLDATLSVPGYRADTSRVGFDWTLDVRGETVSRPGTWTGYSQTTTGSTTGASKAWKPAYKDIVGGVGRLTVTADLPGVGPVTSEPRWISIPGTNPPAATAKAYVDQADPQYAEPIRHLVCVESNWHQFNTDTYLPGNHGQDPIPDVPADWTPNPGVGQPVYGPPAGIGIAQLDPADLLEYWDWQANIQGGIGVWNKKLHTAESWRHSEQTRLDARLQAAVHQANVNRKAHNMPPIHPNPVQVPQLTKQQRIYQAIRYYNGQDEYHYDGDYVLSADGLNVDLVPATPKWLGGTDPAVYGAPPSPDGHWGPASKDLHQQQPWFPFPTHQGYVDEVRNCKDS
jgi:hypothetical protein